MVLLPQPPLPAPTEAHTEGAASARHDSLQIGAALACCICRPFCEPATLLRLTFWHTLLQGRGGDFEAKVRKILPKDEQVRRSC